MFFFVMYLKIPIPQQVYITRVCYPFYNLGGHSREEVCEEIREGVREEIREGACGETREGVREAFREDLSGDSRREDLVSLNATRSL